MPSRHSAEQALVGRCAEQAQLAAAQAFRSQLPQDAAEYVRLNALPRPGQPKKELEQGTVDWASVRRTPARHCACSALLDFLHSLETPPSPRTTADKKICQAQSSNASPCKNHVMPCKNRAKRDNDSRSWRPRTAAPGLARGRMLPSCCAARGPTRCSRADGQLTRAGQHYYQQGLRLQPAPIREGPNDYILLRNGQKKLVRSLQGG